MIKEFRDFIAKGNVMDMAVGIIIGAAFTAVVTSLVGDIINPVIGLITSGTDFGDHYVVLRGDVAPGTALASARDAGATVWAYGAFLSAILNFFIVALAVFMLVKLVNRIKDAATHRQQAEASAAGPSQEALLAEIRDLLAARPPV